MKRQELEKQVVSKIVKQMEEAMKTAGKNWIKPWNGAGGLPKNIRGTSYTGINVFILWAEMLEKKYKSRTFATFKQIQNLKGMVKKGEKACKVIYMQPALYRDAKDGEVADTKDGSVQVQYRLMRQYSVFNLDQTTLTDEEVEKARVGEAVALPEVDQYVANTKADIRYDDEKYANACYYVPSKDFIGMVSKDYFKKTPEGSSATSNYYATLLHELTHWTMHKDRCNRDYKSKYFENVNTYAFEELVAELGSVIQTQMLGINSAPTKHSAQYLNIWLERIKDKPDTFFKASAMAQKAVNYIVGFQSKKSIESNQNMAKLFKKKYA